MHFRISLVCRSGRRMASTVNSLAHTHKHTRRYARTHVRRADVTGESQVPVKMWAGWGSVQLQGEPVMVQMWQSEPSLDGDVGGVSPVLAMVPEQMWDT